MSAWSGAGLPWWVRRGARCLGACGQEKPTACALLAALPAVQRWGVLRGFAHPPVYANAVRQHLMRSDDVPLPSPLSCHSAMQRARVLPSEGAAGCESRPRKYLRKMIPRSWRHGMPQHSWRGPRLMAAVLGFLALLGPSSPALAYSVCVTGASGFLGSEVVHQLLASGHSVRAAVRNREKAAHLSDSLRAAPPGGSLQVAHRPDCCRRTRALLREAMMCPGRRGRS